MQHLLRTHIRARSFGILYLANFLFSFHFFFTIYFNSSFLGTRGISEQSVGILYIAGSLLCIIGLFSLTALLRRIGNYATMLLLTAGEFLAFLVLAAYGDTIPTILAFIAYLTLSSLIVFCSDIFLESVVDDESATGSIRGAFLTTTNIALVLAPLIAGFFLEQTSFTALYLIAAALLVPFFIIVSIRFRNFKDPTYTRPELLATLSFVRGDRDVRGVFIAHLLLRVFFSLMTIYAPLYLYIHLGFSLSEIGIMFSIMLIPFALFELPLGKLADSRIGEKEILIAGFALAALATASLSFIGSGHFVLWTAILFLGRTGASMIEIASESYFFKHVDGRDANKIGFFRATRPLSDIIGPAIGSVALLALPLKFIFLIASLILGGGILAARTLRDTK